MKYARGQGKYTEETCVTGEVSGSVSGLCPEARSVSGEQKSKVIDTRRGLLCMLEPGTASGQVEGYKVMSNLLVWVMGYLCL